MRIESVTAHAFGPLTKETMHFAPGMTVVVGDNESAKSTWHAAIYSAFCGRPRRKGHPGTDQVRFAELHKPWDSEAWQVSAVVELDDGRRIELRHDLVGNADSSVTDLQTARDVANEIMDDGAPDAAVWLGLDRRSFVSTACINQSQLLEVLERADGLQKTIQRAVSTAGTDETAAEALQRLDAFQREHIGKDDARSMRALRRAVLDVDRTRNALQGAEGRHSEYLEAAEEVERLTDTAAQAESDVTLYEAAAAHKLVNGLRQRFTRASELRARLGDEPPPQATQADALATQVARALEAWRSRPESVVLVGPSSTELHVQLNALPEAPAGDLVVHRDVQVAFDGLQRATQALQLHEQSKPSMPETDLPEVSQEELLGLAHSLGMQPPAPDAFVPELDALAVDVQRLATADRKARVLMAIGGALIVVGATVAALGPRAVGALVVVGVIVLVGGGVNRKGKALKQAEARRSQLSIQAAAMQESSTRFAEERRRAVERCAELGLSAATDELQRVAADLARRDTYTERVRSWDEQRIGLSRTRDTTETGTREALAARGAAVADDLAGALATYRVACDGRAEIAAQASRRPALVAQLEARIRTEQVARQHEEARATATDQIVLAARACGMPGEDPEESAAALEQWEKNRQSELRALDAHRQEWSELGAILGGKTFDDLVGALQAAIRDAQDRSEGLDPDHVAALSEDDPAANITGLRNAARAAAVKAAAARGALEDRAKHLPSVSEAEEALASAQDALTWLRELDDVLSLTRRFMTDAQERVQRDLAPVLAGTLRGWLPRITANRYNDAIIDLDTLEVKVCGSERRWRDADRLSHGTAEQIYLLLRVALARHLTVAKESCPLLLDDVTVQADGQRTLAILELLYELSAQQQVVLLAQERTVADWAENHLMGRPDSAVIRLPVVPVT
jgi:exonuclease SbcC